MNVPALNLPEGRQGQVLAIGGALLLVALVWFGLVMPCAGWYESRQDALEAMRLKAAHMQALKAGLPSLRAAIQARAADESGRVLLAGDSDAIAGANLQAALNGLAGDAGTSLDSAETVATQQVGGLRRVGVAVTVSATWPTIVALLTAIESAQPRMVVDDLSVTADSQPDTRQDVTLQASFTVAAFRSGTTP